MPSEFYQGHHWHASAVQGLISGANGLSNGANGPLAANFADNLESDMGKLCHSRWWLAT